MPSSTLPVVVRIRSLSKAPNVSPRRVQLAAEQKPLHLAAKTLPAVHIPTCHYLNPASWSCYYWHCQTVAQLDAHRALDRRPRSDWLHRHDFPPLQRYDHRQRDWFPRPRNWVPTVWRYRPNFPNWVAVARHCNWFERVHTFLVNSCRNYYCETHPRYTWTCKWLRTTAHVMRTHCCSIPWTWVPGVHVPAQRAQLRMMLACRQG